MIDQIKKNFIEAQAVLSAFMKDNLNLISIEKAANIMAQALQSGNKIISCGNGGSLCDAMHFAEELTGRFQKDRMPLPAIAICDPSQITCIANDFGFDYIFSRPVEAWGKPGDVLLGISTSGNSSNVINAIVAAKEKGMMVVGLTGKSGGKIAEMCDVEIRAPFSEYSDRVQEIHIKVIHCLVNAIELSLHNQLFEK